jgi:cyclophilin family peptidyl-prolyl cis-trans isomerase/HEAT repeat protein
MQTGNFRKTLCIALLVVVSITTAAGQKISRADSAAAIPTNTLMRILRAEDERRWDLNVSVLLGAKYPITRKRAALALGRIGDERAVPTLVEVLQSDSDSGVRQMVAFALGEIESPLGADALISVLENTRESGEVRARAVEALGKIGAVLLSTTAATGDQTTSPKAEDKRLTKIRLAILNALKFESGRRSLPNRSSILLGLTAALRVRPEAAGPVIIEFLGYADPRIVADALNTMARLRLKDGSDQVRQLLGNGDAIVRANAARVLGATEDKRAFEALLDRALHDNDLRVRVSAIRALGSLKDARAAEPLLTRGTSLLARAKATGLDRPAELNEILDLVTAIGTLLKNTKSDKAVQWLRGVRAEVNVKSPEVEIALARIDPELYVTEELKFGVGSPATIAQGIAELATIKKSQPAVNRSSEFLPGWMHDLLSCRSNGGTASAMRGAREPQSASAPQCLLQPLAVSPFLQAYAAFKPDDLDMMLRQRLSDDDVIVRATAADLIGDQPPSEANTRALIEALPVALRDKDLNDAALSILDALAKQKSPAANEAIKSGLDSSDHLIRRRAVGLLKANGAGDFSNRIGTVKTRNTEADYRRAIARIGRKVTATVVTSKGAFTIELLPEEAPLTVDNFVQLARKGYFNGQTVPRVVPNFVIQTGDPRGDQNGGPGFQIRCEINEAPYERGAVGMALSGKDTGGSQWFVTHSPQPHLDGGYTVFGRVIRGMDVVDNIARGDTILRVIVNER